MTRPIEGCHEFAPGNFICRAFPHREDLTEPGKQGTVPSGSGVAPCVSAGLERVPPGPRLEPAEPVFDRELDVARIRTVKPGFFMDAELYDAEVESKLPLRLGFEALWCQADREGRFVWKPRELKLACLPYDPCDFAQVLEALVRGGWVLHYEIDGRQYGMVRTFLKHQIINGREADSIIPPFDACARVEHASGTRHDPARGEGKGREGKRKGRGREYAPNAPRSEPAPVLFAPGFDFALKKCTQPGIRDTWRLPQQHYDELKATWPFLDTDHVLRKAQLWCKANPAKAKTAKGMEGFLNTFFGNERGTDGHGAPSAGGRGSDPRTAGNLDAGNEFLRRHGHDPI